MTKYMKLPEPVAKRSGIKVNWYYYDNEQTAREAAKSAQHNGLIDQGRGYDFGYTFPGHILPPQPDSKRHNAHLWEVCVF